MRIELQSRRIRWGYCLNPIRGILMTGIGAAGFAIIIALTNGTGVRSLPAAASFALPHGGGR